jgi:glutamine amidotransferase-like uncharacterized protein
VHDAPNVLLFNGTGTSPNDVAAVEAVLRERRFVYATANSAQLAKLDGAQLRQYRLLIVPGGDFLAMGASLTPKARATVRAAVLNGLNYMGICAGAFLAGQADYPSLNLTNGARFDFYAAAREGTRKTVVSISVPAGPPLDQYWEDGPELTGWGDVVARYPDGTPAVVEGRAGRGWVMLTGIHAEAPDSWRHDLHFRTPASVDHEFAAALIDAALYSTRLEHF